MSSFATTRALLRKRDRFPFLMFSSRPQCLADSRGSVIAELPAADKDEPISSASSPAVACGSAHSNGRAFCVVSYFVSYFLRSLWWPSFHAKLSARAERSRGCLRAQSV